MDDGKSKILLVMLTLIAMILACNMPGSSIATEISSTVTDVAPPTEITIQHQAIPIDLPAERSSHAGDFDSSTTAVQKVAAGGDRFTYGRFERPFNANTMDVYFSQLDIVNTFVYQDETWIYGRIVLKKLDSSNTQGGKYAIELDLDQNGKGDWLVIASNPASTEWSVNGVEVYEDKNSDVGDKTAMFTDKNASGDGYETLIFDQGNGDDADAAWVRISPAEPNTVEIAAKRSVLGNPEKYLINMWAGTSLLDPALFDLNDHFTHEEAGAADAGFELFYPIKQVAEIDNSCKMAVGFEPTGKEPGLCEVFIPNVPGAPVPGCNLTYAICVSQGYGDFNSATCSCIPIMLQ